MAIPRVACATLMALACMGAKAYSQNQSEPPRLLPGFARPAPKNTVPAAPQIIGLTVPKGTSLQVALQNEFRVRKVGQGVEALLVEPVYAFDRLVVPVGSKIHGQVTEITPLSRGKRVLAALDADFSPVRKVQIQFTDLTLSDGQHIPLRTSVTPGSGQVLKLVSAPDKDARKPVAESNPLADAASARTKEAKQLAKDQWDSTIQQLKAPGKFHRLQRYAEAQLPLHRQFVRSGTMYFAELEEPLNFGTETLTAEKASSLGDPIPEGSVVHARLTSLLSSETAQKGQTVAAVLTRPLFDGDRLLLPQGSQLLGTVRQVQAARRLKKNGQLRIAFQQIVPPDGVEQKVQAALVGVQAGKDGNVKLDSEGGAEATTSKSRYGSLALSLALSAAAAHGGDRDGEASSGGSGAPNAGAGGGFKLVRTLLGTFVRSPSFGYSLAGYSAGMSIYKNFLARGHEVVFPKNTAMEVAINTRAAGASPNPPLASLGPNTDAILPNQTMEHSIREQH